MATADSALRRGLAWLAGLLIAATALAVFAGPAAATDKFGASNLAKIKVVNSPFQVGTGQSASGYAECPPGARVISGGVFFTAGGDQGPVPTDQVRIKASSPRLDGTGWYGVGENQSGQNKTLFITAHCLKKSKRHSKKIGGDDLAEYEVETDTVNVDANDANGMSMTCDEGRAITGGVFMDHGLEQPNPADNFYLSAGTTTTGSSGYFGAGRSLVTGTQPVRVSALCLPDTKARWKNVGSDDLRKFHPEEKTVQLSNNQTGGGYALCPGSWQVIGGGTWLTDSQGALDPTDSASIAGSSAAGGGNGWYGSTLNTTGEPRTLHILAACLPRG